MMFNLDLTLIETRLKDEDLHVQSGLTMAALTAQPLKRDTIFVMLLEDPSNNTNVIAGFDLEQYVIDRFAVVIGLRVPGDKSGAQATKKLQHLRDTIKKSLIGLLYERFEPIEFEVGRLIEVNRDTQNVFYQLQFKTAHTVITEVNHYDD